MIEFHYCPVRGLVWFDIKEPLPPVITRSGKRKRSIYGKYN
jgi:Zn-finger nucleic acid-binding protein